MDHEYPSDEFPRASINGSPFGDGDCGDAKNTNKGGYSARWRDDRQLEKNSLIGHEHARSLTARPKYDRVYQHDSRPLAPADPKTSE